MSLRDQLLRMSAVAIDNLKAVIPDEAEPEISIVISHRGTVNDAMVIGDHDIGHLLYVIIHIDKCECEVMDASGETVTLVGRQPGRSTQ